MHELSYSPPVETAGEPAEEPRGTPLGAVGFTLGLGTLSKLTGMARVGALAAILAAPPSAGDAFVTAFLIPEALHLWFQEAGLSAVLVRLFTGPDGLGSWRRVALGATLAALAAGASLALWAGPLVDLLAPGFSHETLGLAAAATAALAGYVPLAVLFFVLQAALNARGHFAGPALGPTAFNLVILGTVWLRPETGPVPLARMVVAAGGAQLACALLPALVLLPWRPAGTGAPGIAARALALAGPTLLCVGLSQIEVLVERVLLSPLGGATFRYATARKLVQAPLVLVGVGLAAAFLPYLARAADREGLAGLRRGVGLGLELLAWTLVPACFLLAGAAPAVSAALPGPGGPGSGADELGGLLASALVVTPILAFELFLGRGHLARGDARTPFWAALAATVATVSLDFMLVPRLGAPALFLSRGLIGMASSAWLAARLVEAHAGAGGDSSGPSLAAPLLGPVATGLVAALGAGLGAEASLALAPRARLAAALLAGAGAGLAAGLAIGVPDPRVLWSRVRALAPGSLRAPR